MRRAEMFADTERCPLHCTFSPDRPYARASLHWCVGGKEVCYAIISSYQHTLNGTSKTTCWLHTRHQAVLAPSFLPATRDCREEVSRARGQLSRERQKAPAIQRASQFYFYFNWTQCSHLCLSALSSHIINLSGPRPSLILITIAPKSLLTAMVSDIIALSLAHWDCTLGSQGRSSPCAMYLYSMRPFSRATNPCCCNKYVKGALTDSLGSWLQQSLQYGALMPASEPSNSRTSTHVESGELSIAWEQEHAPGKVLWSDAASETAQEITALIWSKASFPTET